MARLRELAGQRFGRFCSTGWFVPYGEVDPPDADDEPEQPGPVTAFPRRVLTWVRNWLSERPRYVARYHNGESRFSHCDLGREQRPSVADEHE